MNHVRDSSLIPLEIRGIKDTNMINNDNNKRGDF